MSDEELAKHLNKLTDSYPGVCRELPECHADLEADRDIPLERCEGCWIRWLREPVEQILPEEDKQHSGLVEED